jgi:hypothetical protein
VDNPLFFQKNSPRTLVIRPMTGPTLNCRFEFQKRRQLFIRSHNETVSVAAMQGQQ